MSKLTPQERQLRDELIRKVSEENIAKCDDLLGWAAEHLIDAPHYQALIKEIVGGVRALFARTVATE